MCGIVAGNDLVSSPEKIKRSLQSIKLRGPDETRIEIIDEANFMAFNLLGLNSKNAAQLSQPFINDSRNLFVSVNGEIYNHNQLRAELEQKGCQFKSQSDCEVILHGLEVYGTEFLSQLNGEFAIVAYFKNLERWVCAVDHVGTKPLKYVVSKNRFLVASSVAALKQLDVEIKIDQQACLFNFYNACLPSGKTLFDKIYTIPPGHFIEINKSFKIETHSYKNETSFENINNHELGELFKQSVKCRIPKNFKLALTLSGGVDSSLVALTLKELGAPFSCYSVDFPNSKYSEKEDIEVFCSANQISTTFINATEDKMMKFFPESILNAENLSINPHSAGKLLINKSIVAAGHRVCMTGDGADELFWGYDHFHTDEKFQFIKDSNLIGERYLPILKPELKQALLNCDILKDFQKLNSNPSSQEIYYHYWLNEYGLKILGDSQAASQSLEYRYPFVDRIFIESQKFKMRKEDNFPSKKILRNLVHQFDTRIATVPKRPFTAPFISSAWMPLFEKYVFNIKFRNLNFFDFDQLKNYILRLKSQHLPEAPHASSVLLCQILSLGIINTELCNE